MDVTIYRAVSGCVKNESFFLIFIFKFEKRPQKFAIR